MKHDQWYLEVCPPLLGSWFTFNQGTWFITNIPQLSVYCARLWFWAMHICWFSFGLWFLIHGTHCGFKLCELETSTGRQALPVKFMQQIFLFCLLEYPEHLYLIMYLSVVVALCHNGIVNLSIGYGMRLWLFSYLGILPLSGGIHIPRKA